MTENRPATSTVPSARIAAHELFRVSERCVSLSENGMSESQGERELSVGQVLDEPLCSATIELNRTSTDSRMTAETQSHPSDHETQKRIRQCPKDTDQKADACNQFDLPSPWKGHFHFVD